MDARSRGDEQYRLVFDGSVEAQVIADEDGVIEVANRAAEALLGYRADELAGRNVSLLMSDADAAGHDDHLRRFRTGGTARIVGIGRDVEARHRDGSSIPVHLSVSEIRVGGERKLAGSIRDLRELRAARDAARAKRDRYASILAAVHDGLLVVSADGVVTDVNERFLEMVGLSRPEAIGVVGPPFPWQADPGQAATAYREILRSDGGECELLYRHASGRTFPGRLSAAPVHDSDGRTIAMVATLHDLGQVRAAEEEARRREAVHRRMEVLLATAREERRMKDEFIATISHELRTPLASVLGYLELALADEQDPAVRELLEVARRNGDRLEVLVRDLLALARASAGDPGSARERITLGALAGAAADAAAATAHAAGVRVEVEVEGDAVVVADPAAVRQAIDNLVANAVKFSPGGGDVHVGVAIDGATGVVRVSDRGPGIPRSRRERVFEAFYRGPEARDAMVPGTGLGLAVARAIAQEHGGTVTVRDRAGGGSTFVLSLPLGGPEGASASVEAP